MGIEPNELLSATEAGRILNISPFSVRALAVRGQLEAIWIAGRRAYPKKAVDALKARRARRARRAAQ